MATENKTGILKKREPMNDEFGEQLTWSSDNGLFYKWIIEIDGKEGSCLSKDQDPWWKPGMSIKYTMETKGNKVSFKGLKKPEPEEAKLAHIKEAYAGKNSYNDPVSVHQLSISEALGLTIWLFKELSYNPPNPIALTQNSLFLYKWIMTDPKADKDTVWNRIRCLKASISCIKAGEVKDEKGNVTTPSWMYSFYPDTVEKMTAKVLKLADEFVKLPMVITKASLGLEETK